MIRRILIALAVIAFAGADWSDYAERSISEPAERQVELQRMLVDNLQTQRGIAFNDLMMKTCGVEAAPQSHSIAIYLIQMGGRQRLLDCIREARLNRLEDRWARAFRRYYGFSSLGQMQLAWVGWVQQNRNVYLTSCADGQCSPQSIPQVIRYGAGVGVPMSVASSPVQRWTPPTRSPDSVEPSEPGPRGERGPQGPPGPPGPAGSSADLTDVLARLAALEDSEIEVVFEGGDEAAETDRTFRVPIRGGQLVIPSQRLNIRILDRDGKQVGVTQTDAAGLGQPLKVRFREVGQ